jgi:hypothetical protein
MAQAVRFVSWETLQHLSPTCTCTPSSSRMAAEGLQVMVRSGQLLLPAFALLLFDL